MKSICVFCGSSSGAGTKYSKAARELGRILAAEKITLVYGGGGIGLMGDLADAVMRAGGKVTGVIPQGLMRRELGHSKVTDLRVTKTMHERKDVMHRLSEGFIAMPGGIGTLEEFAEMVTWSQLGIHRKPCGLLNIEGYFDRLVEFLDHAASERFLRQEHRELIMVDRRPKTLVERMKAFVPPSSIEKWMD